ncbi:hypothetical protein HGRIS_005850 [Hohenbuehelia grisea]|uniref:Protein-tyrosine-phosphatase n=1 Tax=Hohenbuehelia grisea TaxID=104357 RepID=A0ABR3JYZ3_9AGAR
MATAPSNGLTEEQVRNVVAGPGDVEWRYEMRRECQEILPGLLLGPFVASKSLEVLQSMGITHIVCIRDAKEAFSVRPRFLDHFQYLTLDVEDNEEQNLIRLFPACVHLLCLECLLTPRLLQCQSPCWSLAFRHYSRRVFSPIFVTNLCPSVSWMLWPYRAKQFIDNAIAQGGRVLVHCNGGISLSPAFVVMFVMQHHQLSWEDALHMVQNRRYCISPNGGFLTQIKEYEAIYKANIAVSTFNYPNEQRPAARRKRNDEDDDESREDERKRPLMQSDEDPDAMQT